MFDRFIPVSRSWSTSGERCSTKSRLPKTLGLVKPWTLLKLPQEPNPPHSLHREPRPPAQYYRHPRRAHNSRRGNPTRAQDHQAGSREPRAEETNHLLGPVVSSRNSTLIAGDSFCLLRLNCGLLPLLHFIILMNLYYFSYKQMPRGFSRPVILSETFMGFSLGCLIHVRVLYV